MSNTNIKCGRSARGRVIFCGAMVNATIVNISDWNMPHISIPHNPSWQELNRGKQSKRERRK